MGTGTKYTHKGQIMNNPLGQTFSSLLLKPAFLTLSSRFFKKLQISIKVLNESPLEAKIPPK